MEKRDLKKIALKGIIGGIVLAAGSAEAAMSGAQSYLAASCGGSGGPSYGATSYAPSSACGGASAPSGNYSSSGSYYAPSASCNGASTPSGYTVSGQPTQAMSGQPVNGQPVQSQRYYYNQGQSQPMQGQPMQGQPAQPIQNAQPTQNQLPKATDQSYRSAGSRNYVADAATENAMTMTTPITREEFLNHLTEQAKAQFNSLTPENQKKVIEVANRVADRIKSVREGAQRMQEKRSQMTKEEFQTYLQDQTRAWFNGLSAENQQKVLDVINQFAERVQARRDAMRSMQERRSAGSNASERSDY